MNNDTKAVVSEICGCQNCIQIRLDLEERVAKEMEWELADEERRWGSGS